MTAKKKPEKQRYQVPNLRRGIEIMETLSRHPHGMTMSEIARVLDLPNNSVFRITMTLTEMGYLQRDKDSRKVSLTRKLMGVAFAAGEYSLVEESLDDMRLLRDKIGETVLITVLGEDHAVVLEQVVGLHPFKFFVTPGATLPIHASAHGKAFMAYLPENERDAILDVIKLTKFNARTISSKASFMKEIDKIRECGYAIDRSEQIPGVHCVAAPIFDRRNYPIAAITVTGPETRIPEDLFPRIGKLIIEHASKISRKLGCE